MRSVRAEDGGGQSTGQVVEISVVAASSGPPAFTQSLVRAEVLENSPRGSRVAQLQVVQNSSARGLFYSEKKLMSKNER